MTDTATDTEDIKPKRKRSKAPPKEKVIPEHGTRARYGWKKDPCRCKACREANTQWQQDYRDSKKSGRKRIRRVAIHGTRAKYVSGCHCEECTLANRNYQREMARLYRAGTKVGDMLPDDLHELD